MNLLREKLRCTPMGAGLRFGDGGDSSQDSATTTNNTTNTIDRRTVADGGSIVVGDGGRATVNTTNNSTTTDLGAIQAAADLGQKAIVGATTLATEANAAAGKLSTRALDLGESITDKAIGEIKSAYRTATEQAQDTASGNKQLATIGMIVAGLLGLAMLGKHA